jgi:hypothetical protein
MVNMALIPLVIPLSKETKPKLPHMCPRSYIARTATHHGKIDAMFDYSNRVLFSYINGPGVLKRLQSSNQWFTKRSATSMCLTIGESA